MDIPILCLATLGLVIWVCILKATITELKRENRKLKEALRIDTDRRSGPIKTIRQKQLPGEDPEFEMTIKP